MQILTGPVILPTLEMLEELYSTTPEPVEAITTPTPEDIITPILETFETLAEPLTDPSLPLTESADAYHYDLGVLFGVIVGAICVMIWAVTFKI